MPRACLIGIVVAGLEPRSRPSYWRCALSVHWAQAHSSQSLSMMMLMTYKQSERHGWGGGAYASLRMPLRHELFHNARTRSNDR